MGEMRAMLEDTNQMPLRDSSRVPSEEIGEFGRMEREKEDFYVHFFHQRLWTEEERDRLPADFNSR
eukprot:2680504-Rhodomonas_salina.1